MPEVGTGERAGMRSSSFGRGTKDKHSRKTPGLSPRCQRRERNVNHVCEAAGCSEAGGEDDRPCRGKQQRVKRLKAETGQVPAKPQTPRAAPRWLSPAAAH